MSGYDEAIKKSFIWNDLYRVRNMRQAFQNGFIPGFILAGLMTVTGGLFPGGRFKAHRDSEKEMFLGNKRSYPKSDGEYIFDKLSSVYASGNRSRENQPDHIRIQKDVPEVIAETWINMCPAQVYEWNEEDGRKLLRTDPSNCVQCGAITFKGGLLTAALVAIPASARG